MHKAPAFDSASLADELAAAFPLALLDFDLQPETPILLFDCEAIPDLLVALGRRENDSLTRLIDLTALDRLGQEGMDHRFEVVYLAEFESGRRLSIRAAVPEDRAILPSVTPLFRMATWAEREVFDLFGLSFRGHPRLERLLTHVQFEGHPLRRDFSPHQPQALDEAHDLISEIGAWGENPRDGGFSELVPINLGPLHPGLPAMLRILAKMRGDRIEEVACEIGYVHRGIEKELERVAWSEALPHLDRLSWNSPFLAELAWCETVEKMMGVEVPERARILRVLFAELSRISEHLVATESFVKAIDLPAALPYLAEGRERLIRLQAAMSGSRHHPNSARIGGMAADLPGGWQSEALRQLRRLEEDLGHTKDLICGRAVIERQSRGLGVIDADLALSFAWSGPCLRASGREEDRRIDDPTSAWRDFDVQIKSRIEGDVLARVELRLEEITESLRIVREALARLPRGEIQRRDLVTGASPRPAKSMSSFGPTKEMIAVPRAEIQHSVEGANGELGFFLVSDAAPEGLRPRRSRCRAPSFHHLAAFPELVRGVDLSEALLILSSLHVVAGEFDR